MNLVAASLGDGNWAVKQESQSIRPLQTISPVGDKVNRNQNHCLNFSEVSFKLALIN